jgi:uncharacterized protein
MPSKRLGTRRLGAAFSLLFVLAAFGLSNAGAFQQAIAPTGAAAAARQAFLQKLIAAAVERTNHSVRYDGSYVRIPYPGGDVPAGAGVCTDEIIRSYRAVGIDLQREVHEDMLQNFAVYPNKRLWGLAHPDSNIDHRRVPNLMVFFRRKGESLPAPRAPKTIHQAIL